MKKKRKTYDPVEMKQFYIDYGPWKKCKLCKHKHISIIAHLSMKHGKELEKLGF